MNNKKICIQPNKFIFIIIISFVVICSLFYIFYKYQLEEITNENQKSNELLDKKIDSLQSNLKNNQVEKYNNQVTSTPVIEQVNNGIMNNNPQKMNAMDRVFNPLRYPYKSDNFYDQNWYPNLNLPSQVIGCGSRRGPCIGGSQVPIYNPSTPIDISNNNIAPVYVSTRGPLGEPQQVGILYKIYGDENDTLPFFGRRKYPNERTWEYYTLLGNYGSKVPVVTKNKHDELGTNDIVFIKGRKDAYRATIYESDFPQYIPYL